jgi:hypothetical protein
MTAIEEIIGRPEDTEKRINEAFEKGFHFEWLGISHMWLDQLLKSYIYIELVHRETINKETVAFLKSSSFGPLLKIAFMLGLITIELYEKLKIVSSRRNLFLHNLILKNEKLSDIKLQELKNLCLECHHDLITQMLKREKIYLLLQGPMQKLKEDLKNLLEEKQDEKN